MNGIMGRLPRPGPSCSKLTMSLVNDSLKFTSNDTQICCNFLLKKMWVAFAVQKLLTFFSAKNIRLLYIEPAKTVNEMILNELVKLTTLWKTGPWPPKDLRIFTPPGQNWKIWLYLKVQFTLMIDCCLCTHQLSSPNEIMKQVYPLLKYNSL